MTDHIAIVPVSACIVSNGEVAPPRTSDAAGVSKLIRNGTRRRLILARPMPQQLQI